MSHKSTHTNTSTSFFSGASPSSLSTAVSPSSEGREGRSVTQQRPPTAAQRAAALRHKVHKLRLLVVIPSDTTDRSWASTKRFIEAHHETMRPAFVLNELVGELTLIGDDPVRRLSAHRRAFESVVNATEDEATFRLLEMIFTEYERSAGKGAADTYNLLLQKKEESDRENRYLASEKARLERRVGEMELHVQNLERKLKSRTEQLTELSARHNIPLHFTDDGVAFDSKTRSLSEIRGYQEKLRAKVAGTTEKDALSKERLAAIEKQMAEECEAVEANLGDIALLEGVVVEKQKVPPPPATAVKASAGSAPNLHANVAAASASFPSSTSVDSRKHPPHNVGGTDTGENGALGDAESPFHKHDDDGITINAEGEVKIVVDGVGDTPVGSDAEEDAPITTAEVHASAQHPRYGGGQVCVDLEADPFVEEGDPAADKVDEGKKEKGPTEGSDAADAK